MDETWDSVADTIPSFRRNPAAHPTITLSCWQPSYVGSLAPSKTGGVAGVSWSVAPQIHEPLRLSLFDSASR